MTGMYASIAVCAAIAHRAVSGRGQYIDMALLDTQVAFLSNQGMNYLATGEAPVRLGNTHPNIVPYQTFRTADGAIILACGNDNLFRRCCDVAGCGELASDARFATNGKRVENRVALTETLDAVFAKRTTKDWVAALDGAGVPNGPINDLKQVFEEPQVVARGMRIDVPHPTAGTVPMVASPMRFSATPISYEVPPPTLGQHTAEVLAKRLSMSAEDIERLRRDGIV
jgi:crotonobetainyl-CoA:carnitine CoA-transferase CaiB-like acyl-CoA transferase